MHGRTRQAPQSFIRRAGAGFRRSSVPRQPAPARHRSLGGRRARDYRRYASPTERANASDAPAMGGSDRALPGGQVALAAAPVVANARKAPPTRWCRSSGARWCRRTRGRAPPAAATAQTAVIDAPPLAPALKPLELIPAIVVETVATSDALVDDGPIPLTTLTFDPPTPTLKPIAVASSARSGMVSSPDDDPAAGKVAHGKRRTSAA